MTMATHRDPVCGMNVEESGAAGTSQFEGRTYYFCNRSCKTTFDQNPKKFVTPGPSGANPKPR